MGTDLKSRLTDFLSTTTEEQISYELKTSQEEIEGILEDLAYSEECLKLIQDEIEKREKETRQ